MTWNGTVYGVHALAPWRRYWVAARPEPTSSPTRVTVTGLLPQPVGKVVGIVVTGAVPSILIVTVLGVSALAALSVERNS